MSKEKISSQEITDQVAAELKISKRVAEEFLKVLFASVEEALLVGDAVKIKGFGTFKLQWNEPRKSVNVNTGEEIVLEGYNKVTFTPDTVLKDIVNEPFAHLEPVLLEDEIQVVKPEKYIDDELPDPMGMFNEQANEIKDILSEINALSSGLNNISVDDQQLDVSEESVVEQEKTQTDDANERVEKQPESEKEPVRIQDDEALSETKENQEIIVTDLTSEYLVDVQKDKSETVTKEFITEADHLNYQAQLYQEIAKHDVNEISNKIIQTENKHKKTWLVFAVVFLVVIGGLVGTYNFSVPVKMWVNCNVLGDENFNVRTTVKTWITTLKYSIFPAGEESPVEINQRIKNRRKYNVVLPVVQQKIDTVQPTVVKEDDKEIKNEKAKKPVNIEKDVEKEGIKESQKEVIKEKIKKPADKVDALQQLFDKPRVYSENIATERIKEGKRLTLMSLKYYGCSDFWVYIYEANRENIENPDHITSGTIIHIPKLDPRLIDANNPRCIRKAKELHDLYVGKK